MKASDDVNRVQKRFGKQAEFLLVYLREAHPADGWSVNGWSKEINDPLTQAERNVVATQCGAKLAFDFPILVDTMDDKTAIEWAAWPERIFVIGKDGKVAYAGQQGPWGFWPSDRFKQKGKNVKEGQSLEAFLESYLDPKRTTKEPDH